MTRISIELRTKRRKKIEKVKSHIWESCLGTMEFSLFIYQHDHQSINQKTTEKMQYSCFTQIFQFFFSYNHRFENKFWSRLIKNGLVTKSQFVYFVRLNEILFLTNLFEINYLSENLWME